MIIILISLRKATKKIKRPVTQIPPIRKRDGKWARNNEQKMQPFAEHLEHVFQPHGSQKGKEMITEEIVQENEEIKLVTSTEGKEETKNNKTLKKHRDLFS